MTKKYPSSEKDVKTVLRKIFSYHSLAGDRNTKLLWLNELENFPPEEIERAWNRWRNDRFFKGRKPEPMDILRIIKSFRACAVAEPVTERYQKGTSFAHDLVLEGIDRMHKNMPDLDARLRECSSVKEKLLLGFVALGKPNLINFPMVKFLANSFKSEN